MYREASAAPALSISDDTTERILDAALTQFESWGFKRTTVEDVARRAGLSRVTVHRRFGTKEALAQAVLLREEARFFRSLYDKVGGLKSAVDRLVEGFAFGLDYMRNHSALSRLLKHEPEQVLPYLTTRFAPALTTARNFIAGDLRREIGEGRLRADDADVLGELLARLVVSFLLTSESAARLSQPDDARAFARRYLAPALMSVEVPA